MASHSVSRNWKVITVIIILMHETVIILTVHHAKVINKIRDLTCIYL